MNNTTNELPRIIKIMITHLYTLHNSNNVAERENAIRALDTFLCTCTEATSLFRDIEKLIGKNHA